MKILQFVPRPADENERLDEEILNRERSRELDPIADRVLDDIEDDVPNDEQ